MVEVAIVQATTAGELPHSLDGVEFGTVSGQEVQGKVMGGLFPPRSVQAGRVSKGNLRGVHNPAPGAAAEATAVDWGPKQTRPLSIRALHSGTTTAPPAQHDR